MKYYAGIGSRETPEVILSLMTQMAHHLARNGYILRSGGAQGADKAFEVGCDLAKGDKEIYLPWRKFQESDSKLVVQEDRAYEIAEKFHPYWHNLSQGAKKLQARNSHQVLGADLKTPSEFVICYTKGGKGAGGTGQAVRIASAYGIPVFDCGLYEGNVGDLKAAYRVFLKKTAS